MATNHVYKFNIGDNVKAVISGQGISQEDIGLEVNIIEMGNYSNSPGYKVDPAIGNTKGGFFDGFIGEKSFELVTPIINKSINTQIKPRMAKTKSITKKVTQEVRSIETSLINKEEVFKMLALAEATGLACLLIGEPGVNSK